jgi:hypothetical protein
MAFGASGLAIVCFIDGAALRRFGDLVRPQASRADANPPDAAIDHRPHGLKVRLEAPCADIVRMAMLPADDRAFSTNLATLGHQFILETKR